MTRARPRLPARAAPAGPRCPGCARPLEPVEAAGESALRCPGCRGLWVDRAAFQRLSEVPPPLRDALSPAPAAHRAAGGRRPKAPVVLEEVRYRRCPTCADLMNRVNFPWVSGVILDVCRRHGAFLDAGGARRYAVARDIAGEREQERIRRERDRRDPFAPVGGTGLDGLDLMLMLLPWLPTSRTPAPVPATSAPSPRDR